MSTTHGPALSEPTPARDAGRPPAPDPTVTGVVLAGGQSRRFGSDKALVLVDGRSLLLRVLDVVSSVTTPVFVSVAERERRYDVAAEHLVDRCPGAGPLAGLHAGLLAATTPWLLLCACDLPFITSELLRRLLLERSDDPDAVLARVDGEPQPVCALYHRRIIAAVEDRLEGKTHSMKGLVDRLPQVRFVDVPAAVLRNINRPSDLA